MIHICIPAHNEDRTIGVLLWKIRKVMAEFGRDYHILVLNDASTDDTEELLEKYAGILPLSPVHESRRLGYAGALERLLREAVDRAVYPKRDSVVTLQGDFTENPEHVVTLVKRLEGGADIVAGSVAQQLTDPPRGVRFTRWVAPRVAGRLFREVPVEDPLCGLRAYRVIVLKKALREVGEGRLLRAEGWAANVELLGRVAPHARRIEDAALDMRYDIRSRSSRVKPYGTLRDLFRIRNAGFPVAEQEGAA